MNTSDNPLNSLLDELSLELVTLDPENLMAMGGVLERLEGLQTAFAGQGSDPAIHILAALNKILEAAILEQIPDKTKAMDQVGRGLTLLQEIARSLSGGMGGAVDLAAFFGDVKAELNLDVAPALPAATRAETEGPQPASLQDEPPSPRPSVPEAQDFSQDQDLFFSFITESMEHIESIEVNIITLEQAPQDKDTINAVFRPFHTIKGVSGFLNLRQVHRLTHEVENLLDDARNDRLDVSPGIIDLVLDAVDILKRMINDLRESMETGQAPEKEYGIEAFIERIHAVQQGETVASNEAAVSVYSGQPLGEILVEQGIISEKALATILDEQEEGRLRRLGEILVERGIIGPDDLEEALERQMTEAGKRIGEILIESGKADPMEISQALRSQEQAREQKIGEMLIRGGKAEARDVAEALREQKKAPEGAGSEVAHTVKVDTLKLDNLVDLVGELVIAQSLVTSNDKISTIKDQKLNRDLGHMSRIMSELQRTAMGMRMVPIRQTFQKMIRLVRDLSRKSGKRVNLTMSGEDTEIDRNMVEAIYDPMVHMIRNSVDHGIEPPDIRGQRGKPEEGRIHLRAFHQGGNVVIAIEDDGQGLNRERIMAKAVERGLVNPDEHLSDAAAFNLIFQPGFSTAEKITDVSGRGVGMDVVKKAIEKLRGKIEVVSESGRGSTITIRLPLTLAIIDGMIVRVGDGRYILPTMAIHESFRPQKGDYHTVKGRGEMIKVREHLLPLVRLAEVVGQKGAVTDPADALVVVLEHEGQRRCVLVDEVIGKQEVVIKSLGEALRNVRALAGGSILGDGRVGLILDVAGLFEVSDHLSGAVVTGRPMGEAKDDWGMDPA